MNINLSIIYQFDVIVLKTLEPKEAKTFGRERFGCNQEQRSRYFLSVCYHFIAT